MQSPVDKILHAIIGLRDPSPGERVGLAEVRAGLVVLLVDVVHDVGLGEGEQVVVALDGLSKVLELLAAEVFLGEFVALDHGAHGAVDQHDALRENLVQVVRRA